MTVSFPYNVQYAVAGSGLPSSSSSEVVNLRHILYRARVYISRGEVNCFPARDHVESVVVSLTPLEEGAEASQEELERAIASRDIVAAEFTMKTWQEWWWFWCVSLGWMETLA